MSFTFIATQRNTLASMRIQAESNADSGVKGAYVDVYKKLFEYISDGYNPTIPHSGTPKAGVDPAAWTFIRGVADVNRGDLGGNETDFSKFIRTYSKEQYKLRFGEDYKTAAQLDILVQKASDAIADRILIDIRDTYLLPNINQIAQNDAEGAAAVMFTDGQISGWAGTSIMRTAPRLPSSTCGTRTRWPLSRTTPGPSLVRVTGILRFTPPWQDVRPLHKYQPCHSSNRRNYKCVDGLHPHR